MKSEMKGLQCIRIHVNGMERGSGRHVVCHSDYASQACKPPQKQILPKSLETMVRRWSWFQKELSQWEFQRPLEMVGVDERPNHDVFLDTFYIDKYEVTNGRYLEFITQTGHRTPQHPSDPKKGLWQGNIMPESVIDLPVINVDWYDAEAYCTWAGKRLPTEAEWAKAAKGPNDWRFPWGDVEPTDKHLNFNQTWRGEATLVPVGIYEAGKSPYGAYDMAGNVWEWVADWYDPEYYSKSPERNPPGPKTGTHKVLRSSGWQGETPQARIFTRIKSDPLDRNHSTGFRCAKDAEQP